MHIAARSLMRKILRQGYYWPTIRKDTEEFVKTCDKCQRFSNISHQPAADLRSPRSLWTRCKILTSLHLFIETSSVDMEFQTS
ncbi:hypothetical protein L2V44_14070 [Staphylococcus aureus]|nr:hypothetical protein [Staphylococcus aureus]